jgi:hypothetical protein
MADAPVKARAMLARAKTVEDGQKRAEKIRQAWSRLTAVGYPAAGLAAIAKDLEADQVARAALAKDRRFVVFTKQEGIGYDALWKTEVLFAEALDDPKSTSTRKWLTDLKSKGVSAELAAEALLSTATAKPKKASYAHEIVAQAESIWGTSDPNFAKMFLDVRGLLPIIEHRRE